MFFCRDGKIFKRYLTAVVAGVLGAVAVGLLEGCEKPNVGAISNDPSGELLMSPVYSPLDSSIYYVDSGRDSAYFAEFRQNWGSGHGRVVQPGIYRIRLNGNTPAELVAANGILPEVTPDSSTLYYINGGWGGTIWRKALPEGEPELFKDGSFGYVRWYSPDTLVVRTRKDGNVGTYFLDLKTDSLHPLEGLQFSGSFDVGSDGRIVFGGVGVYDPRDSSSITISNSEGRNPRWSPDGTEIVFQTTIGSGVRYQIRITDFDGNERTLASGAVLDPDFTIDGGSILYVKWTTAHLPNKSWIRDGQIWMMSADDGSNKRQITTWSRIRANN